MRQITFVTPSTQGWHLNRKLANICLGEKCTISTSTTDPLSLFLCISEGPCVEGNEDRKVKRKRREISQSVCVIWPFRNLSLSRCCCSSLCAAVGFHVVEKWFPFVSLSCQSPLRLSLTGRRSIYIINNVKINVYLWSELKVLTFDISHVVSSALRACAWLIIQRRICSIFPNDSGVMWPNLSPSLGLRGVLVGIATLWRF